MNALYPYKLRGIKPQYPNHIWGVDITLIRLASVGWMYLVAIVDWYSRYVVTWEMDQTLKMPFVMTAVNRALSIASPTYFNSDQGSHFTSTDYIEELRSYGDIEISMDGKGRAIDNIITERFWRSLKYEEVFLKEYRSPNECRRSVSGFIEYYLFERPHMSLKDKTPAEVYWGHIGALPRTPEYNAIVLPKARQKHSPYGLVPSAEPL